MPNLHANKPYPPTASRYIHSPALALESRGATDRVRPISQLAHLQVHGTTDFTALHYASRPKFQISFALSLLPYFSLPQSLF